MSPGTALPLAVALPLFGASVLVLAGRRLPRVATDALAAAFAAAVLVDLTVLWCRTGGSGGSRVVEWAGGWRPRDGRSVGIVLVGDRFGVGVALLAALLVLAVIAYSWRYFEEPPRGHPGVFPALVLLFETGVCGFSLTGDLFNSFVFFELMGVAAVALTGFHIEDPRPLQGALTFGILNALAGCCMLLGIGLLYARTGELGFAQIGARLAERKPDALLGCAVALVLTGLLVKSASAPFHFWHADAHTVAPTPVNMLLAGVMVPLGVYGVARVSSVAFGGPGGLPASVHGPLLTGAGTVTALLGAVMCWQQRNLKRLLAFSTVAHAGLLLIGVAPLTADGLAGTSVYVAGHAGVNAALFGLTGIVLDRYGSVDERELHGKARELPVTGAVFLVGGLALAGLPPFGTALGKSLTEHAASLEHAWLPAVFVVVSAVTGGAVLRAGLRVFFGTGVRVARGPAEEMSGAREDPEVTEAAERRVPRPMLAVPRLLLAASLAAGTVPAVRHALGDGARLFADRAGYLAAVRGVTPPRLAAAVPPTAWTREGVLYGLLSATLAAALGLLAVRRPGLGPHRVLRPLLRLHSGRPGDYISWLAAGLAALTLTLVLALH
ncbi:MULTISPECIES: complex I subunit 5 family protein [unclassified Streptomyces]|uniref:complex I subunit 5 family protein n=1 Tax=unclassified Streptomyces TaxID=2593676 RepID=UPI0033E4EFE0